jgi:hypothetical protein
MVRAQRARTQQRWLRRALVAAMVGAMGAGAFFVASVQSQHAPSPSQITVAAVEMRAHAQTGSTEIARAEQRHVLTGERSMALSAGDVIRVGARGSLMVMLPHAGSSEWHAGSVLDVREVEEQRQGFNLRQGHVAIDIPADAPPRHLVVTTPHADIVVVGTVLDVSVMQEDQEKVTEVSVQRGHVDVVRQGRTIASLSAGESWSSRRVAPVGGSATETDETADTPEKATPRLAAKQAEASTLREQNRLYRAALDARNAGRDEQAVALLSQLLTQYPTTPLAQEAKVERLRALRRLGRSEEASQAARRYLAEHGDGFARDEARDAALPSASKTE